MSVKEVIQALGNWGVTLKPDTPRELIREIEQNKFGHIAILPGKVNPREYGDGLLRAARYVGVYRSTFKQQDDTTEIKGVGMAFWLGDEDEKGAIIETPVVLNNQTFPNSIRALLPDAVKEGTLYSVSGNYTNTHQWETPRKAIQYIVDTYTTSTLYGGSLDRVVEYRVNGDATLDAGPIENLYVTQPRAILVKRNTGRDMRLLGLEAEMSMDYDVEDLTTRVVLLAQGEGDTISTGAANAAAPGFKDLFGNPIKMTRIISESGTTPGNATTRAQMQLSKWSLPRQAVQIRTQEFDIKGDFSVGDYIYVFDPDSGFYDLNEEVFWRGQPINPLSLRIKEMDWNIRAGWTVAFRKNNGDWLDLSEYYKPEGGGSTLAVGDYRRTLAGNNYEPIGFRPNLPLPGSDSTTPGAPEWGEASTGVYETDERTMSAVQLNWFQPLNGDGSTITDGSHYEIRYRPNAIIGATVPWDLLGGGYEPEFTTSFTGTASNGFGTGWSNWVDSASNLSVSGGLARILHPTVNSVRGAVVSGSAYTDVEILASSRIDYLPTGASTVMGVVARRTGDNKYYWTRVEPNTNGTVTLKIIRSEGGGTFVELYAGVIPGMTHVSGQVYWNKTTISGRTISVKVWTGVVDGEPTKDTANVFDVGADVNSGNVGIADFLVNGSSNAGVSTLHSYFRVRALTSDDPAKAYDWDSLGSWDAPTSPPVAITTTWEHAAVGWDSTTMTLMSLGVGVRYEFQIRAVDSASPPHFGPWSSSLIVETSGDIIAPSQPSPPEVAASMIAVQLVHRLGKSSGGEFNLQQDLSKLEVFAGDSQTFLPDASNKIGDLFANGAMIRAQIPAVGSFKVDQAATVWIRVIAVDRMGNRSDPSDAVQSTVNLIDDAHISNLTVSKVTAGTITAEWLMAGAIKTAATGARVEMSDQGIRAYNGSGTQTVAINAADGSAKFTGELQTEVNGAGIRFWTYLNTTAGNWTIRNSTTGAPLSHYFSQRGWDQGVGFGQSFVEQISRASDNAGDGGKLMLMQEATVLSHQPNGHKEAYLALGGWPYNWDGDYGYFSFQGKLKGFHMTNGQHLFFAVRHVLSAGFSAMINTYGPTTQEYMIPNVTLQSAASVSVWLSSETATNFQINWSDTAAHRIYVWAVRIE